MLTEGGRSAEGHKAFPAISFFEINPQKDTQAGGSHNEGASGLRVQLNNEEQRSTRYEVSEKTSSLPEAGLVNYGGRQG